MIELDCGDNSCAFAKERKGMRTNGGCRCWDRAGFGKRSVTAIAHEMLPKFLELRAKLQASEAEEQRLSKAYEDLQGKWLLAEASCAAMRAFLEQEIKEWDGMPVAPVERMKALLSTDAGTRALRVIEAAKKFHDFIGDGNNGPPPFYLDAFNEFEDVLLADWEAL